jgi:hypothetical protein
VGRLPTKGPAPTKGCTDASQVSRGAIGLLLAAALIFVPSGSASAYGAGSKSVDCSPSTTGGSTATTKSTYDIIVSPPESPNNVFPYEKNWGTSATKTYSFNGARSGTWVAVTGGTLKSLTAACLR